MGIIGEDVGIIENTAHKVHEPIVMAQLDHGGVGHTANAIQGSSGITFEIGCLRRVAVIFDNGT